MNLRNLSWTLKESLKMQQLKRTNFKEFKKTRLIFSNKLPLLPIEENKQSLIKQHMFLNGHKLQEKESLSIQLLLMHFNY